MVFISIVNYLFLSSHSRSISFQSAEAFILLFGPQDSVLRDIESIAGITISARGGEVFLQGAVQNVQWVEEILQMMYQRILKGDPLPESRDLKVLFQRSCQNQSSYKGSMRLSFPFKKQVIARSKSQEFYINSLLTHDVVFGIGPAGTGKTYLAVAVGVSLLLKGVVDRLVLSRPAVSAGENLGFLPGDSKEKMDPYMRPLYDALSDLLPAEMIQQRLQSGHIEIAPLAYMRGRTLNRSFVILDEAQNATNAQMKMFLTRLGVFSQMAIVGDPSQVDLPPKVDSGLSHACSVLKGVPSIVFCHFREEDVCRHPVVTDILRAYQASLRQEGE
jgi:phosphate starvation-inducible PhoH-like protein